MIIEIECILKVPLWQRMNDKHAFQFKLEGTIQIFLSPFLLNIVIWRLDDPLIFRLRFI